MRTSTTRAAAAAALLVAALTACSGPDHTTGEGPNNKPTATAKKPNVDCSDQNLDQATWVKHCASKAVDGSGTGGDGTTGAHTLAWGKPAKTVGAQSPADGGPGGGPLEVTPTTVIYTKTAMGNTATNGTYVIIAVKDRATGATAAAESAPIEGGGWQWIAPDGQALDEGENDASSITPNGFTGGGMTKAGTYQWDSIAFDLTTAQAHGGTIAYADGAGTIFQWKVPATDRGPELAAVKRGMEGNY